jgi:hypothetical protein
MTHDHVFLRDRVRGLVVNVIVLAIVGGCSAMVVRWGFGL